MQSDEESQRNIAPFLENPVLKRIVQTFCNDPKNDFNKWATNPRIIDMLTRAKKMMDEGRISSEEVEYLLISHLQNPTTAGHEAFSHATKRVAKLETNNLVGALNEQCKLRWEGNKYYHNGQFEDAKDSYLKALSVMNIVGGQAAMDQEECDKNKAACLGNLCAACMGMQDFGEAVKYADQALDLFPHNLKLMIRRARANCSRGEFEAAMEDLEQARQLDPTNWELDDEAVRVKVEQRKWRENERERAKGYFPKKM